MSNPIASNKKSFIGNIEKIVSSLSLRPIYLAASIFLLALVLHNTLPPINADYFLAFHLLAEIIGIVVCFAVFAVAVYGFQQTGNRSDMVLGLAMAMAGCFDFVHTLSFKGMPRLLWTNSAGLASAYWVVARLTFGVGIIAASLNKPKKKDADYNIALTVAIWFAILIGIIWLFTIYNSEISQAMYNDERGSLTELKIILEVFCILLYVLGIYLINFKRGWDKPITKMVRTALVIAIVAELFFCWFRSPYDWYNAAGHILKTVSYLCILHALFVYALQRPYTELTKAKDRLRELYQQTRQSRTELENSFTRIGVALSASVRVSEASLIVAQLAREISRSDCAVVKVNSTTKIDAQQVCSGTLGPCVGLTELADKYGREATRDNKSVMKVFDKNPISTVCVKGDKHSIKHMLSSVMVHESVQLGTISLFRRSNNPFKEREINLVNAFAQHAGVAIHNAISFEREQHIASILQEYITHVPPVVEGKYDIGYLYKPVMDEASVGGDFLDIIKMPGNKIGLTIGDVAGKGLKAAVHTAMLKYAIRAFLSEGHSPAGTTKRLEVLIPDFIESDRFIAIFIAVLDTDTGELVYTNAGHEPPILCQNDICGFLSSTGPVLGTGADLTFGEERIHLKRNNALVMFTDGLTERGADIPDFSTDTIAKMLKSESGKSCSATVEAIYQASRTSESGEVRDDVAILGIKVL